ncbi:MAG: bifunctional nuclease family protein [Pseudomonadota bacterium]
MKKHTAFPALAALLVLAMSLTVLAQKEGAKKGGKDKEKAGNQVKKKKGKDKAEENAEFYMLDSNGPIAGGGYLTVLRNKAGDTYLPIFIGSAEGKAIDSAIARQRPVRPMTHDLIASIVSELGGEVMSLTVSSLKDNTYIGTLAIKQGKKTHEIDCRPSDGMGIAFRTGADIKVMPEVVKQAGMTGQEMLLKGYPVSNP